MNSQPHENRKPTQLFLLIAASVILGNALIVSFYPRLNLGVVPEWPIAVDLLVLLPLIYLWLYRRAGKRVWLGTLAMLGVGVLVGSWILPAGSKVFWPWLEQARWLLLGGVILVQGILLGLIVNEVYRARHGGNLETTVHAAIERRLGTHASTALLQLEARMWMYALLRDPLRRPLPGEVIFYGHTQNGNLSNQQGFLILMGAEIPLLHLVLHFFNPSVALLVTTLSIYGWIFLLGEYRATHLRSLALDDQQFYLRYGLLHDLRIPLSAVHSVALNSEPTPRSAGLLRARISA
jgi:hypothetical protein